MKSFRVIFLIKAEYRLRYVFLLEFFILKKARYRHFFVGVYFSNTLTALGVNTMSGARKRSGKSGKSQPLIGAQTTQELYGRNGNEDMQWQDIFSFAGKHENPTWWALIWNMLWEVLGTAALVIVVIAVRGQVNTGSTLLNGFILGVVSAATFFGLNHLPTTYTLRRHYGWHVSMAYLCTLDIGLFGFLAYLGAQTLGAMTGGFIASAFVFIPNDPLLPLPATVATLAQYGATVPTPHTGISGAGMVFALEFFGVFLAIFALLAGEFWATRYSSDPNVMTKNHLFGVRLYSFINFAWITAFYVAETWTLNPALYLGGLFAGLNKHALRAVHQSASMGMNQLDGTVFKDGSAWNYYTWGPLAGALSAGLLFALFFYIRYGRMVGTGSRKAKGLTNWQMESIDPDNREPMVNPANIDSSAYLQHASGASLQTRAEDLSSPYHKME